VESGENCDDEITKNERGRGMEGGKCTRVTNGVSTGFSGRAWVQVVGYLITFPLYVTCAVDTVRCTAIHPKCKGKWFCYQLTSSLHSRVFITDCRKL
jgi:hypothetical protein